MLVRFFFRVWVEVPNNWQLEIIRAIQCWFDEDVWEQNWKTKSLWLVVQGMEEYTILLYNHLICQWQSSCDCGTPLSQTHLHNTSFAKSQVFYIAISNVKMKIIINASCILVCIIDVIKKYNIHTCHSITQNSINVVTNIIISGQDGVILPAWDRSFCSCNNTLPKTKEVHQS